MTNSKQVPDRSELWGHPKGLYILFFTEMWERFSYYGMRAILVLYMASSFTDGGMGWTKASALELYGWYTMLVYVMSIPGGILADKLLGQKKSVLVGGLILVAGHSVLAIEAPWAFFTGLGLIVLGVGALKPNISTMVGQLYPPGDERRDKGFTIFYIGINIGAFLSSLIVGYVGEKIGWHYGFGLAGIGMLLGQIVYMWGQKFLIGVGDFVKKDASKGIDTSKPLTKIEKDRVIVLLLSFIIIIVFWGAFEQAGGLLNFYADEKINRSIFGWEMPASWFQSFNAMFIIIFGTAVAAYWANRKTAGKETSTLLKMGVGTIIMGAGFLLMSFASKEASTEPFGTATLWWLVGAYLLHTIGELCASPTALSFITKLAPLKYSSIMMGVYFAATGFGNKLAGSIGESAQAEPIGIELTADPQTVSAFVGLNEEGKNPIAEDQGIAIRARIYPENNDFVAIEFEGDRSVKELFAFEKEENRAEILEALAENNVTKDDPFHATFKFEKDFEAKKVTENKGDGKNYAGTFVLEEIQSEREFKTFTAIFVLTLVFGILIILLLKKLKALTHGAEDLQSTNHEEQEGFELADKES